MREIDAQGMKSAVVATFTNAFGERWRLTADPKTRTGTLLGDETDQEPLPIFDGTLQADFMLADDEAGWLAGAWKSATGEALNLTGRTWTGVMGAARRFGEELGLLPAL